MLSKQFIIETINYQLKNISQIEYSRHRNLHGFYAQSAGGLTRTVKQALKINAGGEITLVDADFVVFNKGYNSELIWELVVKKNGKPAPHRKSN